VILLSYSLLVPAFYFFPLFLLLLQQLLPLGLSLSAGNGQLVKLPAFILEDFVDTGQFSGAVVPDLTYLLLLLTHYFPHPFFQLLLQITNFCVLLANQQFYLLFERLLLLLM
jgi:hypothetical protein